MTQPQPHRRTNRNFPFISSPITGQMYGADWRSTYASPFSADGLNVGFGVSCRSLISCNTSTIYASLIIFFLKYMEFTCWISKETGHIQNVYRYTTLNVGLESCGMFSQLYCASWCYQSFIYQLMHKRVALKEY